MGNKCIFIALGGSWTTQSRVPLQFRELGISLSKKGFKVVYIIQGKPDHQLELESNIFYWPSRRPTNFIDALFFYKLVKKYKPTLLITQWAATNIMLLLGWILRVPHRVVWYHTLSKQIEDDWQSSALKLSFLRFRKSLIYRLATCISFVSKFALKDFEYTYFSPRNSKIFYNGMKKRDKVKDTLSEKPYHVCCVARLDKSKGQDILIQAFKQVSDEIKDVKLILIGDGPARDALQKISQNYNLDNFVTFEGSILPEEVLNQLMNAWISVLPSRMDNCPFAIIESIGSGIPVIASNVGGIPEIIRDGVDGFLVPPKNPIILAQRIIQLLKNPDLHKEMSINALQRFEEKFELTELINQQADWFEALINK